jgi:hypothetical protein
MQARHEKEQKSADIIDGLASPLGDEEEPVIPLGGGVTGDEPADAPGDDGC